MNRRELLKAIGAAVIAPTGVAPMVVVRPTTDCDIAASSLIHAVGIVGAGPYALTVPPENVGYARAELSRAFGAPERFADFTIKARRLDQYVDSWALDNGRVMFYTTGA